MKSKLLHLLSRRLKVMRNNARLKDKSEGKICLPIDYGEKRIFKMLGHHQKKLMHFVQEHSIVYMLVNILFIFKLSVGGSDFYFNFLISIWLLKVYIQDLSSFGSKVDDITNIDSLFLLGVKLGAILLVVL
jgi:hypothetical protein